MKGVGMSMKMLTIVCREKLQDELETILSNQGITGYTLLTGAGGRGKTGVVSGTHGWTDRNLVLLVVQDDNLMTPLLQALKEWRDGLVQERSGHEVPLKLFLQSCDVVL